ncbi:MAG TPA: serine/threonine-protein kinase, partial [Polyangiaceae bacterium]|nr:serine/threonine-protein kinase [Polyangiaceae bacterium]
MKSLPKRFRDPRVIGEGALGIVYEAWDQVRKEHVALKTLHKASPGAIRDFKREFRAVADVSHENLVVLHELFCQQDLWFFTMELVQGEPLLGGSRVSGVPQLPVDVLRRQLVQLARGISALHQIGVIHRDIKPQNVLVEAVGRVVLLDYGMATSAPNPGASWDATFAGSPGYVAPELVFGESLSLASDWYSFGCVLYEALTGVLPFEDGAGAILMRKLFRDPTPPSRLAAGVPADLEQLCMALLDREPGRRPDAQAVMLELGDDQPVSRPRVIPSSPPSPPGPRVFVGRGEERQQIRAWLERGP